MSFYYRKNLKLLRESRSKTLWGHVHIYGKPVLWNRNDLLRFRFRLWKSLGSDFGFGSGPAPVPIPYPDLFSIVFQQQHINVRSSSISHKVGLSFMIFWLLYSILCWPGKKRRKWELGPNQTIPITLLVATVHQSILPPLCLGFLHHSQRKPASPAL
jgi:hypothetical protein